jgi:hypothetical protein
MSASVSFRARVPSAIVGTTAITTTETQFKDAASAALVSAAGAAAATATACYVAMLAEKVDGQMMTLQIGGRVTGGGTTNVTLNICYGKAAAFASNTTIATSGAVAVNSANTNFGYIVRLMWDSTSLILQGVSGDGWMGTTPTIHTKAITTAQTAVAATTLLAFTVTCTYSASFAGNAAYLTQFDLLV